MVEPDSCKSSCTPLTIGVLRNSIRLGRLYHQKTTINRVGMGSSTRAFHGTGALFVRIIVLLNTNIMCMGAAVTRELDCRDVWSRCRVNIICSSEKALLSDVVEAWSGQCCTRSL